MPQFDGFAGEGFVAQCAHCGAAQGIVLGARVPPCRFCGAPEPITGSMRARLGQAAHRLAAVAAKEHRRLLTVRMEAETAIVLGGVTGGATWLVVGGGALLAIGGNLPKGSSFASALTGTAAWRESPSAVWALFALVAGFAVTLSLYFVSVAVARGAGAPPRGLPPLEGGAPRCPLCGGGLTEAGVVRACRYCGARNLIDGKRLDGHVRDLLQAVGDLEAADAAAIAVAHAGNEKLAYLAPLLALFGPLAGALVGAVGAPWNPSLLAAVPILGAPAVIAALVAFTKAPLGVRALSETGPGDPVRIRGAPFRVHAILEALPIGGLPLRLHVVGPEGAGEPSHALWLQEFPSNAMTAFALSPGGGPLEPQAAGSLQPIRVLAVPASGTNGQRAGAVVPNEQPQRIFAHPVSPGAAPIWTLSKTSLDATRIYVA